MDFLNLFVLGYILEKIVLGDIFVVCYVIGIGMLRGYLWKDNFEEWRDLLGVIMLGKWESIMGWYI